MSTTDYIVISEKIVPNYSASAPAGAPADSYWLIKTVIKK